MRSFPLYREQLVNYLAALPSMGSLGLEETNERNPEENMQHNIFEVTRPREYALAPLGSLRLSNGQAGGTSCRTNFAPRATESKSIGYLFPDAKSITVIIDRDQKLGV